MTQLKIVPRKEGDAPLAPAIADAIRKSGMDPGKWTVAPGSDVVSSALPRAGARVRHNFGFATLNGAFAAIERVLDDDIVASVSKTAEGYRLTLDAAAGTDDNGAHAAIAQRVADLGGTDEGMMRETIAVNTRVSAGRS